MYIDGKKIFLGLVSVLATAVLSGCGRTLVYEDAVPKKGEIRFGVKGVLIDTKSVSETSVSSLVGNGFNCAAVFDDDNSVMYNTSVAQSDDYFRVPDKPYFFPAVGTMSFYAVYPKTQSIAMDGAVALTDYSQNAVSDLVVAKNENVGKQSDAVNLPFDHILSQVSVRCKGSDTSVDYVVKSIILTAPNGGTYDISNGEWITRGGQTDYTYFNGNKTVSTIAKTSVGESMSFVPGEIGLRVVWSCDEKGASTNVIAEYDESTSVVLVQGKRSTLNVTLPNSDAKEIVLNLSLNDWSDCSHVLEFSELVRPDMIDLGLPSGTKWANINIGASREEEFGLFFKWGDTEGHGQDELDYFNSSYPFPETTDNILTAKYDAATLAFGDGYRMPTPDDFKELLNNTNRSVFEVNGVAGVKFTSKVDSQKYIFIPRCTISNGTLSTDAGAIWGARVFPDGSKANHLRISSNISAMTYYDYTYRYIGYPIRAISD